MAATPLRQTRRLLFDGFDSEGCPIKHYNNLHAVRKTLLSCLLQQSDESPVSILNGNAGVTHRRKGLLFNGCNVANLYRAEKKSWYVVARNFFLLLLHFSAWPCLGPA